MKTKRQISVLIFLCIVFLLTACSSDAKQTENKSTETYTSDRLGVYRAQKPDGTYIAADKNGKELSQYEIDENGNICAEGVIVIKAEDSKTYRYLEVILSLSDSSASSVTLPKQIKPGTVDEFENGEVTVEFKVYASPAEASNPKIRSQSMNPEIAETAAFGADVQNEDGSITTIAKEGIASIYLKCRAPGNTKLLIKGDDGSDVTLEIPVSIKESKNAELTTSTQINEDLIETTSNEKAWLVGQNIRFRERPDSNATIIGYCTSGTEVTVLGRNDGWTKCRIGDRTGYIKSEYVTGVKPAVNTPSAAAAGITSQPGSRTSASTPQPSGMPAASNDGKDHGLAFGAENEQMLREAEAIRNAENHTHYYVKYKTVPATATEEAYIIYRCDCGAGYRTKLTRPEAAGEAG